MSEVWTIKKILDWTQTYFKSKSLTSPRLDAELLLAQTLKLTRLELYLYFDRPLTPDELVAYKILIKRRSEREPVAYILGNKDFYSRNFLVSPAVLVPRPDSEVLIEATLKRLNLLGDAQIQGFEMGVGSGCLSITLLCESPHLSMIAIDISSDALKIAAQNAENHAVQNRLELQLLDFFKIKSTAIDSLSKYNFIIANPPYISMTEFPALDPDVTDYEPQTALTAEQDGLSFYKPLGEFAKSHLSDAGFLIVEIGNEQGQSVQRIFKDLDFTQVACHKDYAGHDRFVIAQMTTLQTF